jgi:hypothetical protein
MNLEPEKFDGLRMFYPVDAEGKQLVHRENLTPGQRRQIVARMRRRARALGQHARALEAEGRRAR